MQGRFESYTTVEAMLLLPRRTAIMQINYNKPDLLDFINLDL